MCRIGPSFDYDFVKVLDFGLVKSQDDRQTGGTELTAEGVATGTPAFMAPEMALGQTEVDGRADIYCLGCVGYWLITGQRVFEHDNALATVVAHVQEQPDPPSQRTELVIPNELERTILACLEKDPAARPQSAAELEALLGDCATDCEWSMQAAEEWWNLHESEAESWMDIDEIQELSPEEILRVER